MSNCLDNESLTASSYAITARFNVMGERQPERLWLQRMMKSVELEETLETMLLT
jgi:hypothetical protein